MWEDSSQLREMWLPLLSDSLPGSKQLLVGALDELDSETESKVAKELVIGSTSLSVSCGCLPHLAGGSPSLILSQVVNRLCLDMFYKNLHTVLYSRGEGGPGPMGPPWIYPSLCSTSDLPLILVKDKPVSLFNEAIFSFYLLIFYQQMPRNLSYCHENLYSLSQPANSKY